MAKYKTEAEYNRQIIDAFKGTSDPEILIVVSKLLTGFDAPRNTVPSPCGWQRRGRMRSPYAEKSLTGLRTICLRRSTKSAPATGSTFPVPELFPRPLPAP